MVWLRNFWAIVSRAFSLSTSEYTRVGQYSRCAELETIEQTLADARFPGAQFRPSPRGPLYSPALQTHFYFSLPRSPCPPSPNPRTRVTLRTYNTRASRHCAKRCTRRCCRLSRKILHAGICVRIFHGYCRDLVRLCHSPIVGRVAVKCCNSKIILSVRRVHSARFCNLRATRVSDSDNDDEKYNARVAHLSWLFFSPLHRQRHPSSLMAFEKLDAVARRIFSP